MFFVMDNPQFHEISKVHTTSILPINNFRYFKHQPWIMIIRSVYWFPRVISQCIKLFRKNDEHQMVLKRVWILRYAEVYKDRIFYMTDLYNNNSSSSMTIGEALEKPARKTKFPFVYVQHKHKKRWLRTLRYPRRQEYFQRWQWPPLP